MIECVQIQTSDVEKKAYVIKNDFACIIKKCHGYKLRRRTRIIHYVNYKLNNPLNYFREQIMLYVSWRKEEVELQNADCEKMYYEKQLMLIDSFKKYNKKINNVEVIDQPSPSSSSIDATSSLTLENDTHQKLIDFQLPWQS